MKYWQMWLVWLGILFVATLVVTHPLFTVPIGDLVHGWRDVLAVVGTLGVHLVIFPRFMWLEWQNHKTQEGR